MKNFTKKAIGIAIVLALGGIVAVPAFAIPALQLGPGSVTDWTYDNTTDTWVYSGSLPLTLSAYANATKNDGGNGKYAWKTKPDSNQYAYLVAAAMPKLGDIGDIFDITISGTTFVTSGYGTPPVEDPNSLAPHGIFDTYFEIYEFKFDGSIVDISDQQPGETGTGKGYKEDFTISWSDLTVDGSVTGIHFDLFTVTDGRYVPPEEEDRKLVYAFAPYSHDAETGPGDGTVPEPGEPIPEPAPLALLALGSLLLGWRKFRHAA